MSSSTALHRVISIGLGLVAMAGVVTQAAAATSAVMRGSDWLGHVVVTGDGQELGTVRDFAIDERTGKVVYVVVSVGSFLIENNLIAVAPDALVRAGGQDAPLRLEADPEVLRKAKRFATDSQWPAKADVVHAAGMPTVAADTGAAPPPAAQPDTGTAPPASGTATISSPTKTAHLSANERSITETPGKTQPAAKPAPVAVSGAAAVPTTSTRPEPITPFDRLDKDGDGVLNRSEFANQMSRTDSYSKIDQNANGVIDRVEFDAFEQTRDPSE
jgi:sporulation protein YlmC with PRC-barrel domain